MSREDAADQDVRRRWHAAQAHAFAIELLAFALVQLGEQLAEQGYGVVTEQRAAERPSGFDRLDPPTGLDVPVLGERRHAPAAVQQMETPIRREHVVV